MKSLPLREAVPASVAAFRERVALNPSVPTSVWWKALAGPAEDFLLRPGKELRGSLVRAGWRLAGGSEDAMPDGLPLILELLHAGSLVIDDVEDDSLERRGQPALHHVVGVPLAINTGSWMYFWALAEIQALGLPAPQELAVYRATSSTLMQCHHGQALDLAVRISDISLGDCAAVVSATTRFKTGALCGLATSIGAHARGTDADALHRFGVNVGTALQMLDDVGSITTRRDKAREDLRGERPTWPWAWLAETNPFMWSRLVAQLRAAHTDTELDAVSDVLVAEVGAYGREQVHQILNELRAASDDSIRAALTAMENSYG